MENLTDKELQELYNNLRGDLLRKKGNEKGTPGHLISSLYKELSEINDRMNKVKEEATKRGIELL